MVTFDDVAAELSAVTGRRIGFVPVPDDAAVGQLVAAGAPEWFATNLVAVFGMLRQGIQAQTRDTVRDRARPRAPVARRVRARPRSGVHGVTPAR